MARIPSIEVRQEKVCHCDEVIPAVLDDREEVIVDSDWRSKSVTSVLE